MNGLIRITTLAFVAFTAIACGPAELRPELDGDNTEKVDKDGDGYFTVEDGPADCNDSNAKAYPGAAEVCDGVDNDCDGKVDEGLNCSSNVADTDKDGYLPPIDCDNNNANVKPGAPELCGDSLDNNCDGTVDEGCAGNTGNTPVDNDKDGYYTIGGQIDCNDGDASVKPGAPEVCGNNRDDNCDGYVDENCGNSGGGGGNTSDLWVEVCYPGAPDLQLNVQYYGNGNDVGKYWQKSASVNNSSCVSLTVPKGDLPTTVCGVRLNVTKDSYSWLCEGNGSTANLDNSATIQVNHAGSQYSTTDSNNKFGTWSAPGGAHAGCSALLTFSTSGACAL